MKTILLSAIAALSITTANAGQYFTYNGGYGYTTSCYMTRTTFDCFTGETPNRDAKILTVAPRGSDADEDEWARRCDARLIKGKNGTVDRWEIGNAACR